MLTYHCSDCDSDHYCEWNDFLTLIWVHRDPFYDYRTQQLTTTMPKIVRMKKRLAKLNKQAKRQLTQASNATIVTMGKTVGESNDLLMEIAIEYLKFGNVEKSLAYVNQIRSW